MRGKLTVQQKGKNKLFKNYNGIRDWEWLFLSILYKEIAKSIEMYFFFLFPRKLPLSAISQKTWLTLVVWTVESLMGSRP